MMSCVWFIISYSRKCALCRPPVCLVQQQMADILIIISPCSFFPVTQADLLDDSEHRGEPARRVEVQ